MATIEIVIGKDGNVEMRLVSAPGEDPACVVHDRLKKELARAGIAIEEERVRGHAHAHHHGGG